MPGANFSLDGKVAIVTGAARGIGQALAAALAHAGAAIVLTGRDQQALEAGRLALTGLGYEATSAYADVSDVSSLEKTFTQVQQWKGRVDILINNAGIEQLCASSDVSEQLWNRIVDTNLKGAFFCAQSAARRMLHGGSIVNLCSLTSEVGVAGAAAYGASKSGLAGLTRALATEWAARGIRVNGIGPGYFRTALTEPFYRDETWRAAMLQKIPLQRFGNLEDLGGAAVFLCSEAAAYITGQILYVDGGYLASI
jgi:NAD(P)-dependent dehydrogenase (short-subunit alcohol dehydrogenase family)